MKKKFLAASLVSISTAHADYSCPPFKNRESCRTEALSAYEQCHSLYVDYLHDKENFCNRHDCLYMINLGCKEQLNSNNNSCDNHCD